MKKIIEHKIILFDLDNTLLDFTQAEHYAIRKLANDFNITLTDEEVEEYKILNANYWRLADEGILPKSEILKLRFEDFFKRFSIEVDGKSCDETFRSYLTDEVFLVEDAIKVLEYLKENHDLYIVSNGVKKTQYIRMSKANINGYFKNVFLSDEIGFSKPDQRFFDYVKKHIPNFDYDDVVLIGDNLFSDIHGANMSNIKSVYFNYFDKENTTEYKPMYEIKKLNEILEK